MNCDDVPMTELAPKRTLRSSCSTDAEASEALVVDDVFNLRTTDEPKMSSHPKKCDLADGVFSSSVCERLQ